MLYNLDLVIFRWLNSWALWQPWADQLIIFRGVFLAYWVAGGLLAFGIAALPPLSRVFPSFRQFRKKNFEMIAVALGAAIISRFGFTELIRFFYNRVRPFEALSDVHQLIFRDGTGSFPSGHAVFFFAVAAVIGRYYPKTSILFYLAAFNLSVARIQAGIHWPSDVIGGALLGIAVGLITQSLAARFLKQKTA